MASFFCDAKKAEVGRHAEQSGHRSAKSQISSPVAPIWLMFYVPVLKSQKTGGVRRSCQKRGKRLNCHDTGVAKAMKHGMPAAVNPSNNRATFSEQ